MIQSMPATSNGLGKGSTPGFDFAHVLKDSLNCGIVVIEEPGRHLSLNARAEFILDLPATANQVHTLSELPSAVANFLTETLATGQALEERTTSLPGGHGEDITVRITTTALRAGNGRISGAVMVLNHVSAIQRWEANMLRLDRLHSVGTLSASMAHEAKNALVAVRTFVDLLLEQNKQSDLAEIVRLELNRVDVLLGQMRQLARPSQPSMSQVHLHLLLNKSTLLLQHLLQDKKIVVHRTLAATLDRLIGDPDQLEQALINLIFNALDAMSLNGHLTLATELLPKGTPIPGREADWTGPVLRCSIQDDGVGIPPENLPRLFEPFFTTKPEGTGLGLAITRRIVEEHGGAISVKSLPGQGTTFTLLLPAS